MYVRFVTPKRDSCARCEVGIFGPAYAIRRLYTPTNAPWQVREIHAELCWFEQNLRIPRRFAVQRNRGRGYRRGVCWFVDDARQHVSHGRYLAWLIEEMGAPVVEIVADAPGTVLWRDDHQVVALPRADHPVVFH